MLEITNLRHGTIVNRNFGKEDASGLMLPVEGIADAPGVVTVNGKVAERSGRKFYTTILLPQRGECKIEARYAGDLGESASSIIVYYDRNSFKRFNFYIDDHSFIFTEIARQKPRSLFDHFYLKRLRFIAKTYGAKFTLNIFYRNDHDPDKFTLDQFPDTYIDEFRANSDWLRLSFHAYSEFPDRPYQNSLPETLCKHYDLVRAEILRFAGEETLIPPVCIHWAMIQPDSFPVLKERGMQLFCGLFMGAATYVGEIPQNVCDIGYFQSEVNSDYLRTDSVLYDPSRKVSFLIDHVTCNLSSAAEITEALEKATANTRGCDLIGLTTHEQYSFPHYFNYQADHLDRVELAVKLVTDRGYQGAFFAEGFLGNPDK